MIRRSFARLLCRIFLAALLACPATAHAASTLDVLKLPYFYLKSLSGKTEGMHAMGAALYAAGRKKEAALWLQDAFAKGHAPSALLLADLYMQGDAAPVTEKEGYQVFLQAVLRERYRAQPYFCRYASYSQDHILPDVRKAAVMCGRAYRPLILDLKGKGLRFLSRKVYFDWHDDAYAVSSAWPRSDMGILVHDKNGNGIIDNGSEMITGRIGGAANGFMALSAYDTNGDGILSPADTAWGDLRIWLDGASDGKINPQGKPELFTPEELHITSISLRYRNVDKEINKNKIWQEGAFTIDGVEHDLFAVTLDMDLYNTDFRDSGKTPLPENLKNAPDLRGYGLIKNLHDQLAIDADTADPQSLASLLLSFQSSYTLENVFLPETPLEADILAILFRWAEVDGVDPAGRGRNIDARALAYLDKTLNREFLQRGVAFNPRPQAAADLKDSFAYVYANMVGNLLAQTAARELLTGPNVRYVVNSHRFYGVEALDDAAVAKLVTIAKGLPDTAARKIFWRRVALVLRTVFPGMSAPRQYVKLAQAIRDSDAALDAEKLVKGRFVYAHLPLPDPRQRVKKSP